MFFSLVLLSWFNDVLLNEPLQRRQLLRNGKHGHHEQHQKREKRGKQDQELEANQGKKKTAERAGPHQPKIIKGHDQREGRSAGFVRRNPGGQIQ